MVWDVSESSRLMSHHLVKGGCDHAVGDLYEIVDEEHFENVGSRGDTKRHTGARTARRRAPASRLLVLPCPSKSATVSATLYSTRTYPSLPE